LIPRFYLFGRNTTMQFRTDFTIAATVRRGHNLTQAAAVADIAIAGGGGGKAHVKIFHALSVLTDAHAEFTGHIKFPGAVVAIPDAGANAVIGARFAGFPGCFVYTGSVLTDHVQKGAVVMAAPAAKMAVFHHIAIAAKIVFGAFGRLMHGASGGYAFTACAHLPVRFAVPGIYPHTPAAFHGVVHKAGAVTFGTVYGDILRIGKFRGYVAFGAAFSITIGELYLGAYSLYAEALIAIGVGGACFPQCRIPGVVAGAPK